MKKRWKNKKRVGKAYVKAFTEMYGPKAMPQTAPDSKIDNKRAIEIYDHVTKELGDDA